MSAFQILDRERTLINPTADRVRDVAALARARQRARRGLFLVEGPQAVREALAAHARGPLLDAVYVTPACLEQDPSLGEAIAAAAGSPAPTAPGGASRRVFARLAAPEVLAAMAESQTPQGVLAVAHSAAALTGLPGARDWPGLGAVRTASGPGARAAGAHRSRGHSRLHGRLRRRGVRPGQPRSRGGAFLARQRGAAPRRRMLGRLRRPVRSIQIPSLSVGLDGRGACSVGAGCLACPGGRDRPGGARGV